METILDQLPKKQSSYIRDRLSQRSDERGGIRHGVDFRGTLNHHKNVDTFQDRNELIKILKENTDMDYQRLWLFNVALLSPHYHTIENE